MKQKNQKRIEASSSALVIEPLRASNADVGASASSADTPASEESEKKKHHIWAVTLVFKICLEEGTSAPPMDTPAPEQLQKPTTPYLLSR